MLATPAPADDTLLDGLRRRDPSALSALFEQHADRVYRLAVSLLHDEQQADGVVQNAFLALIEHAQTFEGRANVGTWLYRVAYNECVGRMRTAKRVADFDDEPDDGFMPSCFVDWSSVLDEIINGHEASAEMEHAIASLKPDLRIVFIMRDVEELSTEETAQALGITEGAVKVRLHRARLALREKLASYFQERAQARM
ncbi:MAG: sigma-70 family RNA polymerase sigma factor [Chloroflexota bacterium]|nr:sigma-70 family RNA polymerase sigma factor [Chloroflexota bacterium]